MVEVPHLVLAAGESKRMGSPKALLPWGEVPLLLHQVNQLLQTKQPILVVLGAQAENIAPLLANSRVHIYVNPDWKEGMGTSLSFGIKQLQLLYPNANGVLISLVDQPLVPLEHYIRLLETFEMNQNPMVASESAEGWLGSPALFDRRYFEALSKLKGEQGAKTLLKANLSEVTMVFGGNYLQDMDTPVVYQQLLKNRES